MGVQQVTDTNFETEVLQAAGPVVVDFWAEWCGPCKAFAPVMEEVANETPAVKFVKMNVDESPNTPGKFNIRGIPTLIAFKGGKAVATKVGSMGKAQFADWLKSVG